MFSTRITKIQDSWLKYPCLTLSDNIYKREFDWFDRTEDTYTSTYGQHGFEIKFTETLYFFVLQDFIQSWNSKTMAKKDF